jgi:hypothetical protein
MARDRILEFIAVLLCRVSGLRLKAQPSIGWLISVAAIARPGRRRNVNI